MSDQTVNPDQLPEITVIPPDLRALVASPNGPLQRLRFDLLLAKLIATTVIAPDKAALDADLAHDEHVVGLVHSDAAAAQNGWYRKTGASGAGAWTQFEILASFAKAEVETALVDVNTARDEAVAAAPRASINVAGLRDVIYTPDGHAVAGFHDTRGLITALGPTITDPMEFVGSSAAGAVDTDMLDRYVPTIAAKGQSWQRGSNQNPADGPITVDPVDPGFAFSLSQGVDPHYQTNTAELADLKERLVTISGEAKGRQTIMSSLALGINDALFAASESEPGAEDGRRLKMLCFVSALGGTAYKDLRRGSRTWIEFLDLMCEGQEVIYKQTGRQTFLLALPWWLGETDAMTASGQTALDPLLYLAQAADWMASDLERCMGRQPFPFGIYPLTPPAQAVALQMFPEVAAGYGESWRLPRVHPVAPTYAFPQSPTDNTHRHSTGYHQAGQATGHRIYTTAFGVPTCSLRPLWARRTGQLTIEERLPVPVALAADTTSGAVAIAGANQNAPAYHFPVNKGYQLWQFTGGPPVEVPIAAAAIVAGENGARNDTVRLTLGAPPAAYGALVLTYGRNFDGGLVRSAAPYATWSHDGATPLYDWHDTSIIGVQQ